MEIQSGSKVDSFLRNKYLHGGAAIATIVTTLVNVVLIIFQVSSPWATIITGITISFTVVFIVTVFYSLRFRGDIHRLTDQKAALIDENKRLKDCATTIHQINHAYRDVLHDVFGEPKFKDSKEAVEQRTLKASCERIAEMFTLLIQARCVVTVKLMVQDGSGIDKCLTLARSESNSERDRIITQYEIYTGKNTGFDSARQYNRSRPSYFYSNDLEKDYDEGKYTNERPDWKRFYLSTIIVPIRYVHYKAVGTAGEKNELGFLTVDTLEKHKLNDNFHVQYLAGLADQMYNFMSLMRGKYRISVTNSKR